MRGLISYQLIELTLLKLNISTASLRRWAEQASIDDGSRPGVTADERADILRLGSRPSTPR
jgi:transposase